MDETLLRIKRAVLAGRFEFTARLVGMPIYTKGKLVVESGIETYYFLVSAKRAEGIQ